MARQPKLILRESCINSILQEWPVGSFLETGSGTGYMTHLLLSKGFTGKCFELGEEAREKLRNNLAEFSHKIEILTDISYNQTALVDYLFSFEVLEHIRDDTSALQIWTQHLKPGGKILLSVPAHQRKYGPTDEMVGHVRRYERSEIHELLANCGYEKIKIINYGFPLTELSRSLSNLIIANNVKNQSSPLEERSITSSFKRPSIISSLINFIGEDVIYPFCKLQKIFYNRDWGDGIVATATKKI